MTETQDIDVTADSPAANALGVVDAWRTEIGDRVAIPASDVQDRLLDLWGALPDGEAKGEVERWLTETLERNLYAVSDINERLGTLVAANQS